MSRHVTSVNLKRLGWDSEATGLFKKLGGDKRALNAEGWHQFVSATGFCENAAREILSAPVFESFHKIERSLWSTFDKIRQHASLPSVRAAYDAYCKDFAEALVQALRKDTEE